MPGERLADMPVSERRQNSYMPDISGAFRKSELRRTDNLAGFIVYRALQLARLHRRVLLGV